MTIEPQPKTTTITSPALSYKGWNFFTMVKNNKDKIKVILYAAFGVGLAAKLLISPTEFTPESFTALWFAGMAAFGGIVESSYFFFQKKKVIVENAK